MKNRCRIYIRDKSEGGNVGWCQSTENLTHESLGTTDKKEARRLLGLKTQSYNHAGFQVQMARTHLQVSDLTRTWQNLLDANRLIANAELPESKRLS